MSRTYRNMRPKVPASLIEKRQYKSGMLRDGTPQHIDASCENNGGCPWCEGNRTHKHRRHEPIIDGI